MSAGVHLRRLADAQMVAHPFVWGWLQRATHFRLMPDFKKEIVA
jgi:hypothetical protein